MTSQRDDQTTPAQPAKSGKPTWLKRTIAILIAVVVLVITYFLLAAFIPRWWAQRMGGLADGSFARGITWGLFFGGVCTLVPLLLLLVAVMMWRKRGGRIVAAGSVLLALAVSVPNLMTLGVVLGGNSASHAGERIMDVDAPGFRGASLVAAIVAALVFFGIAFLVVRYRRRGKQLRKARNQPQPLVDPAAGPSAPESRY